MVMIHFMLPQNKAISVSSSLFSVSFSWFPIQIIRTFGHDDEYENNRLRVLMFSAKMESF